MELAVELTSDRKTAPLYALSSWQRSSRIGSHSPPSTQLGLAHNYCLNFVRSKETSNNEFIMILVTCLCNDIACFVRWLAKVSAVATAVAKVLKVIDHVFSRCTFEQTLVTDFETPFMGQMNVCATREDPHQHAHLLLNRPFPLTNSKTFFKTLPKNVTKHLISL